MTAAVITVAVVIAVIPGGLAVSDFRQARAARKLRRPTR